MRAFNKINQTCKSRTARILLMCNFSTSLVSVSRLSSSSLTSRRTLVSYPQLQSTLSLLGVFQWWAVMRCLRPARTVWIGYFCVISVWWIIGSGSFIMVTVFGLKRVEWLADILEQLLIDTTGFILLPVLGKEINGLQWDVQATQYLWNWAQRR